MTVSTHKFEIQERRRQVASLIARAKTESEIAQQLNVNQSTISRDVKILRQLSQKFIYDLAKSDLAAGVDGSSLSTNIWSCLHGATAHTPPPPTTLDWAFIPGGWIELSGDNINNVMRLAISIDFLI